MNISNNPGIDSNDLAKRGESLIRKSTGIDSNDLAKRGESLIRKSTNRYLTTVKIAFRAKQRRFDAVQRSIIELSDEQDQPDLLPG